MATYNSFWFNSKIVFYAYAKYFSDNLATALYKSANATEASIQVGGFIKSMLKKIKRNNIIIMYYYII